MLKRVIYSLIETVIRNIGGGIGEKIRYQYYKRRFRNCVQNVKIAIGVIFENVENISVGNNVWFMPYSIITARPKGFSLKKERIEKKVQNEGYEKIKKDYLHIGSEVQIGTYNIIHGFGGLHISDKVTLSARVSIYSHSHYYRDDNEKSKVTYANGMVKSGPVSCIESPIVLEEGVWLGLGVIVYGGTIGKNSFVTSNSIVCRDLPENSYASGNPSKKIKERFE